MEMRRKDLAVTQPEAMDLIIRACDCIRIALTDGDYPYIIPMNFGYQRVDGQAVFYLHSAGEGHKVSLFRKEQRCGFELDTHRQLKTGATACAFSMAYESIAGNGDLVELTDSAEKTAALRVIMSTYSDQSDWDFPEETLKKTCVFRLNVQAMSGRKHD